MKLQTLISLKKSSGSLIDYESHMLLLGSCFVENIGKKLSYFKFQNLQNPFGVLFHPKAIEALVIRAIHQKDYTDADVFFHNEQWHCYETHSQMSNSSKDALIANLNKQLEIKAKHLLKASHIVITLGTAWVYKQLSSDVVVANCHKVAQQHFKKELLSIKDITESLQNLHSQIKAINAEATVIFTVSPVRHIKDGFVENSRSKAHLIAAVHEFISQPIAKDCFYFPSYELMMDELRDYRFYTEDMLHPNATAITYIWERFQKVWISENAVKTMIEVDAIQKALSHRPFNPNSEGHAKFLNQLEVRRQVLQAQYPHITF